MISGCFGHGARVLKSGRPSLVAVVAMLASWLSAWWIADAAGQGDDLVVVGVVIAVTLSRGEGRPHGSRVARVGRWVSLPLVAVLAALVGRLIVSHEWIGGAVFALAMGTSVWLRRYGGPWTAVASVVGLPFVALLVAPVRPHGGGLDLWPAVVAFVAALWVAVSHGVARRIGLLPPRQHAPAAAPARASAPRIAAQLTVAVAVAYAMGRWWFPDHWAWAVLSAYVVTASARGRGEALHKGLHRLGGALVGTGVATVAAGWFPAGDRTALVLLVVVLGLSIWIRPWAYAAWAAGVTAALSLLYGYYGVSGTTLLGERLLAVTVGATVGVLAAWYVLPVRTSAVFRRRWADALAALSGLLAAMREGAEGGEEVADHRHGFDAAVDRLVEITPVWRLHGRTIARRRTPDGPAHPTELVVALLGVRDALAHVEPSGLGAREWASVARTVGTLRRRMRPETEPATPDPALPAGELGAALGLLDQRFTRASWQALGGR